MSWEDFKKEKQQNSSWEEFKQNREKLVQVSNNKTPTNSISQNIKNFTSDTGRTFSNLGIGSKIGVKQSLNFAYKVGENRNKTEQQVKNERVLGSRELTNTEKALYIAQQQSKSVDPKNLNNEASKNVILPMLNNNIPTYNNTKVEEVANSNILDMSINKDQLKIQENIENQTNNFSKKLAELAPSIGNMGVGTAISALNPVAGMSYFTTSAGGSYMQDALDRGMTREQATTYGAIMGLMEGATEAIGVENLSKAGKGLKALVSGAGITATKEGAEQIAKNSIKTVLKDYGIGIADNVMQEAIIEPIQEVVAGSIGGKDKANWNDMGQRMLKAGIDGGLTSAILGGANLGIQSCVGVIEKTTNGQSVTQQEIQTAVKEASTQLDVTKMIEDSTQQEINKYNTLSGQSQLTQNQQNENIQQITPIMQKNAQNGILEQNNSILNNKDVPMLNYQYEKSDNIKINNLRQDAGKYFNNSEQARNYVSMLEQIITDKNVDIRLDSDLRTPDGQVANGSYSNGVITINPNSTKSGEFIAVHELTHAIGTDSMKNIIETYRKSNAEFNTAVENLLQNYNSTELTDEALSDVSAQLFGNQEFIANVSQNNHNIFKRIYNEIKYLWHQFRGYKNQNQFIDDLYYKWTQAYNSNNKLNETSNYSIAGKQGMINAIKTDTGNLELERNYNKAQQMQENGIDNETIRQSTGWFQDRNGDWKFEFSDRDMSLKNIRFKENSTYKLENILKHDTLFTIYPELANYNVKFTDLNKANGVYNIFDKDIKINNNLLSKKQYKSSIEGTLIHEIQHAIQDIENFEGGRSSKGSKLAYYESLGEIEASDTKARFLQERHKNIDLTDIAPESSKTNPKHQNLDKYLKNRKLLDKAKDGVYNYIKKRNGGNNEFSKENISKNKKQNMGLVDGRRRGRYVDEYEIENITNAGKNNEKNTLENNREDRGIYRDRINNSVQESENNSDSFSLQDNYGRKLPKEQQYLNKNFKTTGTRTNLQDIKNLAPIEKNVNDNKGIKAPIMQKQQNGSINAPISKEVKARKHYKSIMESQYTSSEAKTIAKELMGTDTYVPDSNNSQLERANERILNSTPESELNSFMSKAINGEKITATDIAVGEKLIQYYSKTGDKTKLQDAIQATAMAGTSAGQTVQALSLLNHQTPEGQAIWLQRSVDKMNNDLKKTRGKNAEQFNLTEDMIDKIVNSKDNDDLQNNLNDVYKQLGQQVSKTNLQKIDAWRYFSMLANPKTHIRNIVGNTAMAGVQGVKNKVAGAIEGTISKVNPNMERNHTIVSANKKVTTFAKNDIKNVADRLGLNENKYNPKTRLENSMRTFKSDTLENTIGKLFGLNDNLLEAEDGWGLKAGYTKALSEYMTANNLNPNTITDKQLAKARNYAVEQAQEATFHQASAIASSLNQFQNKNGLTKFIIGSTLPFKKTPINVAKAGLEYSPVGLTKSLIYDTVKLRKGNITVNKYIDNISKGLTGTGIALLGYALADAGILKASGSDDTDKEKYDEEMGKQTYSITIAGNTYSLDWLAPTGIPLFIGAECHELMQTEKEEKASSSDENSKYSKALKSATNILDSFTNAMNPMTEMSMLSGLTSALKSYEQGSSQMIASLGTNAVKSYVNQFVPTALGQIARTTDKYERDTTSTKTGVLPKAIDSTKNQIINKTPALRQILPIKTDIWGNEVKQSDNIIQRELENAVLPWTRKEVDTTKVDNALMELYDETGESSILPDTLDKKLTINGQNYRLTNEEYSKYKTTYGKTSYNLLNSLVSSSEYKSMSNSQKQTAIESIYDYAKEKNKVDYAQSVNETIKTSTNYNILEELRKAGESQTQYLSYSSETKEIQGEKANQKKNKLLLDANYSSKAKSIIYQNTTGKNDDTYRILNKLDSSKNIINQYLDYLQADLKADREDDSTENGKAISGSKKQKVYNYINSIDSKDMSYVQRLYLTGVNTTLSTSDKKKIFTLINENKSLTKNEKLEALDKLQGFTVYKDGKVAW